ncbi:hypothetical protein THOG11_160048 [Vibrio harveyi]|nr:hypothetical protein TH15OA1_930002 [Vibrio harveyi]CAH1551808.1 hypothetical protein THOD03_160043 [Vibrio harveyi]CAH1551839.1 hypothetical protein THOD03_160048 [Vibrio harveyi]CAH1557644.1 hypothetical protein THOG11_160043 [Vibrio harveyi]CAH1557674.1 hypothetical protein THOG11_160048 [Vibrio harveyi]
MMHVASVFWTKKVQTSEPVLQQLVLLSTGLYQYILISFASYYANYVYGLALQSDSLSWHVRRKRRQSATRSPTLWSR